MRIYYFIFILWLATIVTARSQPIHTDSMLHAIRIEPNDTSKVRMYNSLHQLLIGYKDSASIQYSKQGLSIAKKMKWGKGVAVMLSNIAESFANLGVYDSSVRYYNKAIHINEKLSQYDNLISNYINLSTAAKNVKSDLLLATKYCYQALALSEKHNAPAHRTTIYNNLSVLFMDQSNTQKSILYASRGLEESELKGDSIGVATSSRILGKGLLLTNELPKSSYYLNRALRIYQSNAMPLEEADCISSMALLIKNDYDSIIKLRLRANSIFELGNLTHPNAITNMGNLGIAYHDAVRYHKLNARQINSVKKASYLKLSNQYLTKTIQLCNEIGNSADASYFTGCLAELQATQGDFKNAYSNFRTFQAYQDSIYSQEYKNQLAELESKHTIDIKNAEIQTKAIAVKNRNYLLLLLGITALSLLGILYVLSRQNRDRKIHNKILSTLNNDLEESNQLKSKFLSIISHDLRSPIARLVSFLQLQKELPEALDTQEKQKIQDSIKASATTLLANMESLLLWSKSNLDQFKLAPERFLLYPFLKDFSDTLPSSINIEINCPQNLHIRTDSNVLKVIISNIISNAIKSLEKIPKAKVTFDVIQEDKKTILTISDNGPGFPESFLNMPRKDISSSYHGYGWFIIYDMTSLLNGEISCRNANGAVIELILQGGDSSINI